MNDLTPFAFGDHEMRFGVTEDSTPYVVATDFAKALGYREADRVTRLLDSEEWGTQNLGTSESSGRVAVRPVSVIYESGMWELVFRSSKPAAKALKSRVKEILREIRINGGYLSPTATVDQLAVISQRAESQAKVLASLKGIVDKSWLEAKARHVAARALGEEPEVDPATRPLTVGEYLGDKGVNGPALRSLSTTFGKRLKAAYVDRYDREPGKVDRFVDGALRSVAAYTEKHRPLFDRVWADLSVVAS